LRRRHGGAELQEDEMSAGEIGETTQERDLMRLLRNTRWETEACAGYAVDAEAAGDGRFAAFSRDVQKTLRTSSSGRRKCSSTEADEFLPAFDRTANRPRGSRRRLPGPRSRIEW
jgi:hypothetical protein